MAEQSDAKKQAKGKTTEQPNENKEQTQPSAPHTSLDVVPEGLIDAPLEMVAKQLNDLDGFDR